MYSNPLAHNVAHPPLPIRRVVQWATGTIGSRALRAIVEHPALTLAGLYVHSPQKAGRDAGELCGLPATGVNATHDIDQLLTTGADCVLYMPRYFDIDQVCRILSAGIDIVTTRGEFHHPPSMDRTIRARVEAACWAGGTSIHSTGSSPGFITEAVPLVLTSIQRRLDFLAIDEYGDLSRRDSPGIVFDVMGFGRAPDEFPAHRVEHLRTSFAPSLRLIADAVGMPLDAVHAEGEIAVAKHATTIAAGTIEAGTVGAQRITLTGYRGRRALLRFRATWYCTTDVDSDWEIRDTGWHLRVDGDAPLDIDIRLPIPLEQIGVVSPAYTANRAINAVWAVCAAPPGIRTTLDLPAFTPTLG
ncbi:dihydrodipicolinate reductase [Nocardia farcinica]|uniref:dihydrodipicolinate reductase n=1 Tax=Nocardia farcinica TaxID=37329 RepID=UPI00378CA3B7